MVSWISIPFAEELYSETFLCIERDRVEFITAFIEGRRFELFVACENCWHGNFRFAGPLLVAGNCFLRGAFELLPFRNVIPWRGELQKSYSGLPPPDGRGGMFGSLA